MLRNAVIRDWIVAAVGFAVLCTGASQGWAANQTVDFTPIQLNSPLPYRVVVEPYDFGVSPLPTLHSFAAGSYNGQWVLLAGRTNGLHGFSQLGTENFPPESQNRTVWVIDPVTHESWSRALDDATAGLSATEIDSLSQANNQYYQRGDRLYMTGGYGHQLDLPDGTPLNSTFDTLSAIDLPGLVDWVKTGTGSAQSHVRQISDPLFRVTGGDMYEIAGRTHLVFGQDFQGNYTPGTNGLYTNQVRSFDIVDDGTTLSIANPTSTTPDPNYRRRDLNIVPVLRPDGGGPPDEGLMVLSGVFTPTNGAWTVPVEIDAGGNPSMDDPSAADTFKQGFNNYHSAKLGLYSSATGEMHEILFGGISLQYLDDSQQVVTDLNLPFVNDITSVEVDASGSYSQHWLGRFPELADLEGKQLRFGANAEFFLADGIETFDNGVLKLDSITGPTDVGYIFGGLETNSPQVRGVPGAASSASNTIFRVMLIPIPEPATLLLASLAVCAGASVRRRKRRTEFHAIFPHNLKGPR
jgi:PEP-CTERM motif